MIHTIKMYFPLHHTEVQRLQKRFGINYTEVNKYFQGEYDGVTMVILSKGMGEWQFSMAIDAIKLLKKHDIGEQDYPSLERKIKMILLHVLGDSSYFSDHVLQRIDYRYDVVVDDEDTRQLLLDLYKKHTRSHKFQKKYLGKVNKDGVYEQYKTTVYHSSKSTEAVVYSKEEERRAKGQVIEEYEKNVLRYEVRLKEGHLYYMERKDDISKRPRKLNVYMKDELYRHYFRMYMSHIYHPCNFYKLDEARKIIKRSTLTDMNKEKLIDFLKTVSSYDLDTPLKRMTKETRKRRLQMLKDLGINPVTIPKNYDNAPSLLDNPLDNFPW
jgi:hypothetical protein